MLDFGELPPEINSGRMYCGPGSGSMHAAARAWDEVAAEIASAAAGYASVITDLTSLRWLGPTSVTVTASLSPYVAWLRATADLAERAATQARAAAAAYETALAMTVPPQVIASNRLSLIKLIATNFFGQNTPAIAATEADYAAMWAQDAVAMYCYADSAATASMLTPFKAPPRTSRVARACGQAAKTAVDASGARLWRTAEPTSGATVPRLLKQLSSSGSAASLNPNDWWIVKLLGSITTSERTTIVHTLGLSYFSTGITQSATQITQQLIVGTGTAAGVGGACYPSQFAGLGGQSGHRATVSASSAVSGNVGALSVPPSWTTSPSAGDRATGGCGGSEIEIDVPAATNGPGALLRGVRAASTGRRPAAGNRYGFRHGVLARPPSAG